MEGQPAFGVEVRPGRPWMRSAREALTPRMPLLLGTLSVTTLLVVWEVASRAEWVNPLFASRPTAVWTEFLDMYFFEADIWPHLQTSAYEVGVGFGLAAVFGIVGGVMIGRFRAIRYLIEPFLMGMYSTPTVAFLPLFIIWFGIGTEPKIVLVFLGGLFPFLINTQTGVASVSPELLETARSFRASRWQQFSRIILPSALPYILAGTRLAIGRTLVMMLVAELVISNRGLGFIVSNAGARFQTARLFVGVLTLTVAGVALSQAVRMVEEHKFAYLRQ